MNKTQILLVPAELIEPLDQLSLRTYLRCAHALKLWHRREFDFLVVTGGRFLRPNVQTQAAGDLMAAWFLDQGVHPDHLLIERDSLDTYQNVAGSVQALREHGLDDPSSWEITVVSQWQHCWRFWITFRNLYDIRVEREAVNYKLTPVQ